MAHYIDGFVVPVPLRNLEAYRAMAEQVGMWQVLIALVAVELVSVLIPLTTALGRVVEVPVAEPVWH